MDIDSSTWQALGVTLSMAGLLISVLLWKRRGPVAGLRGVAWSLLPAAAGLTGTLRLVWDIGDSVANWAVRLVFSPAVWLGIVLAGVSVVLFGVTGVLRNRAAGDRAGGAEKPSAQEPRKQITQRRTSKPAATDDIEGMDDIEAILRKHGIQ